MMKLRKSLNENGYRFHSPCVHRMPCRAYACLQVRRRDLHTKKVIVEECGYDSIQSEIKEGSSDSNTLGGFNASPAPQPSSPNFGTSFAGDPNDQYAWVNRMQHIPDKDALQKLAQLGYSNDRNSFSQPGRKFRKKGGRG
jgi:hypothetical protein